MSCQRKEPLCDYNWLFDLSFLIDVTGHLNHLYLKLQGKDKLLPTLVNDIDTFRMKFKLFIS